MPAPYPSFSVLMSVYAKDNPAWIAQALDSVLYNTVPPAEVLVAVDGPVGEDIRAVLDTYAQKYPAVRVLAFEKNEGLGAALRKGLEKCTHEWVARMDADDISLPDRFEKQLARVMQEPDLAVLGGAIEEIDAQTLMPLNLRIVPCADADIKKFLKSRSPFNHPSVLLNKRLVLQAGSYQPFHLMEDYCLWARCAANGYKMANLPDVLVRMRTDAALYGRRGGWKYFKSNAALSQKLYELKLISFPRHVFNLCVRFCVQAIMPNSFRAVFYQKVLRK